jgi:hypothetical protein
MERKPKQTPKWYTEEERDRALGDEEVWVRVPRSGERNHLRPFRARPKKLLGSPHYSADAF